jgi:hypothetical protein
MRSLCLTRLVSGLLTAALLQACDKSLAPLDDVTSVASVTVTPGLDTIAPDDRVPFAAALVDSAGHALDRHRVVWSTSDTAVAGVDSLGVVRGIAPGVVVVAAIAGESRGVATVVVRLRPARLIVTPDTLGVGEVVALHFSIIDAAGRVLSDASSLASENPGVLQVNVPSTATRVTNALATGVGTTNVNAVIAGVRLTTSFVVHAARVAAIVPMQSAVIVPVGGTRTVIGVPYVLGGGLLDSALQWASSDAGIASIDARGLVSGHRAGQTIVHGRLQGMTVDISVRVFDYPEAPKFVSVKAGTSSACALAESGRVYCWGAAAVGTTTGLEAGPGESPMTAVPLPIDTDTRFSSFASGYSSQPCALTAVGDVWCWSTSATRLITSIPFASLSVSNGASCGISMARTAYCWGGDNFLGELGDGNYLPSLSPTAVVGGHDFAIVATGRYNGDASTCALTTSDALYCWGRTAISVPDGTRTNVPLADAIDLSFGTVNSGGFNCAITTVGQAYCWNNAVGLGAPSATRDGVFRLLPTHPFTQVSVGSQHACWLDANGAAYCHGFGENGELGTGTMPTDWVSQPQPVAGGLHFKSISAGDRFTCGVTVDGALYCWGLNLNGRVGQAALAVSTTSIGVQVPGNCLLIQCSLPGTVATPQRVMGLP